MTVKEFCLKIVKLYDSGQIKDDTLLFYPTIEDDYGERKEVLIPVKTVDVDEDGDLIIV